MTLAERTTGVLNTTGNLTLRVPRGDRAPLAQVLQVIQLVLANEAELRVEHRGHVAGVEEETVAALPCGILRVVH